MDFHRVRPPEESGVHVRVWFAWLTLPGPLPAGPPAPRPPSSGAPGEVRVRHTQIFPIPLTFSQTRRAPTIPTIPSPLPPAALRPVNGYRRINDAEAARKDNPSPRHSLL